MLISRRYSNWMNRVLNAGFCLLLLCSLNAVHAEIAPADRLISNQASMSFTDAEGQSRTITSDVVQIRVRQVYRLTLEADNSRLSADNASVEFNHVLTNTGNGTDSYILTTADLVDDNFDFTNIQLFLDDGTGNPGAPINGALTLEPGEELRIVVVADIPDNQDDGAIGRLELTATSEQDPAATPVTASNTDTVTINSNAIIRIRKELRDANGNLVSNGDPSSGPYTFNLIIDNQGSVASGTINITDVLDDAFDYLEGSATYTVVAGNLTDADDGDEGGIAYQSDGSTVQASITSLAGNTSQTLAFDVAIVPEALAEIATNQVTFDYDDGTGNIVNDESNEVPFTVNQVATPDANDVSPDGDTRSNTDAGAADDNEVLIETAAQGSTLFFENIITNSGNGSDIFDIELDLAGNTFPVNTAFRLLAADGATPLQDSNGNSTPDTGPLDPGQSYIVVLRVILPSDASGNNGGNGFAIDKTAISDLDPTQRDTVTDRLNEILANRVDLTNDIAVNDGAQPGDNTTNGDGAGAGPEAAFVRQNTTSTGDITTFNLFVNNTGAGDDNYALAEPVLPAGWNVLYYLDDGDGVRNAGDTLLDTGTTGVVPAGDNILVFADVVLPNDADTGEYQVNFSVTSPTTGQQDEIRDSVVVQETHDVTIAPPGNDGTVFPGGQVVYSHTLTNNGNVDEEVLLTVGNSQDGWMTVIYIDNGDGVIGPEDTVLNPGDPLPIGVGEDVTILVEVTAPVDADQGDQNVTTITGTYNDGNNTLTPVTENTVVSSGDADLTKEQALDADCDGTSETTFDQTLLNPGPNECVVYRITATNNGGATLSGLVISDTTPAFTTYETCGGACVATSSTGTVTTPGQGNNGEVSSSFSQLPPNAVEVLTFTVRLDND